MEESEYKSTYNELTAVRCVFEKSLTNHRAKCRFARHFCLTDREGYSCEDSEALDDCRNLLEILRNKSVFALKIRDIDGPSHHNMELRVQVGGIEGLAKLAFGKENYLVTGRAGHHEIVANINAVVNQAIEQYGSLKALPYSEIIKSVVRFKGRRRRR